MVKRDKLFQMEAKMIALLRPKYNRSMGNPRRVPHQTDLDQITVAMPRSMKIELDRRAATERRSRSRVVTMLLERLLEAKKQ